MSIGIACYFARFLAENNLLIHPDYGEPISLEEVRELAREQECGLAADRASFAQQMLAGGLPSG